jgi:DNA invertase Pin-like site-specific DNA recombinase
VASFVSYLRVSTQRQGQTGLGIEAQRAAVEQYVRSVGGSLIAEHVEVESGAVRDRPVLVKSIAQCREAKATLIVAKLDRLGRNVAFVSALMEAGVDFVAVDAPFATPLMVHILAAFAEHERRVIAERTKAALAAAKARGVKLGANGAVLALARRTEAASFAEKLREPVLLCMNEGPATLQDIAEHLNRLHYRTREGARWSAASAHRLLTRLALKTPAMA